MFKLNEKLKKTVLDSIPKKANRLVKVYAVYQKLCEVLDYGMDAYIDSGRTLPIYSDIKNLENVDGETNNSVVCFTFDAIFLQLLKEAGLCTQQEYEGNYESLIARDGIHFKTMHAGGVVLDFDGIEVVIDSTESVIDGGMTQAKMGKVVTVGWCAYPEDEKQSDKWDKQFAAAVKYLERRGNPFAQSVQAYILAKGEDFKEMSLQERVDFYKDMLRRTPPNYSVSSFGYLTELRRVLFPESVTKDGEKKFLDIRFVKDTKNDEYRIIMQYNPEGYIDDLGYENFESLKIYDISLKSRTFDEITIDQLRKKCESMQYVHKGNGTRDSEITLGMWAKGRVNLIPIFEGGKAIYEKNKPINVIGYKRRLHTGEMIDWDEKEEVK